MMVSNKKIQHAKQRQFNPIQFDHDVKPINQRVATRITDERRSLEATHAK